MKNILLSLVVVGLITTHCFADEVELAGKMDHEHEGRRVRGGGWCHLELSEEQQAKMRAEKFKFEESKIDLDAQLKHARLAYRQVLSDPKSDYSSAKAAAREIANVVTKLASAKAGFKAEIAFKIFTADQRAEAAKCHQGMPGHPFFGRPGRGMGMGMGMEMDEEMSAPDAVAMLDDSEE